jgi:hypothetical protein
MQDEEPKSNSPAPEDIAILKEIRDQLILLNKL